MMVSVRGFPLYAMLRTHADVGIDNDAPAFEALEFTSLTCPPCGHQQQAPRYDVDAQFGDDD